MSSARLREIIAAAQSLDTGKATSVFDSIDAKKLRAGMALFHAAAESVGFKKDVMFFRSVFDQWFGDTSLTADLGDAEVSLTIGLVG